MASILHPLLLHPGILLHTIFIRPGCIWTSSGNQKGCGSSTSVNLREIHNRRAQPCGCAARRAGKAPCPRRRPTSRTSAVPPHTIVHLPPRQAQAGVEAPHVQAPDGRRPDIVSRRQERRHREPLGVVPYTTGSRRRRSCFASKPVRWQDVKWSSNPSSRPKQLRMPFPPQRTRVISRGRRRRRSTNCIKAGDSVVVASTARRPTKRQLAGMCGRPGIATSPSTGANSRQKNALSSSV